MVAKQNVLLMKYIDFQKPKPETKIVELQLNQTFQYIMKGKIAKVYNEMWSKYFV